jgi:ABC-type glutathione transport system ATPase component
MVNISSEKEKYVRAVGVRERMREMLLEKNTSLSAKETLLENLQKALIIVQKVAEETQKQIEYHISNLVTMALSSVFPDPYEFSLRFVQRRNKTEADLIFSKNGNEGDPMEVSGGGALDVASFALRAAVWSLKPTRRVLIMDEPFKFVSRDLQPKCFDMMKMISEKLGIQLIVVSHVPEIIDKADKVFEVVNQNGVSIVEEEENV